VSLRLQINLIIAVLMALFIGAMVWQQVDSTRGSVREEIAGSNQVATRLLARVSQLYETAGLAGMTDFLQQLGRVRANDVYLYDPSGGVVYSSPASTYKSGRDAPGWYARLVSPPARQQQIEVGQGRLVVVADSSRAVLDGWDALVRLLWIGGAALVIINVLVFWLMGRVLRPLRTVVAGLEGMRRGDYTTRLPTVGSREGRLMSEAFNRTAQALAEGAAARRLADEAGRKLQENRELTQMIRMHVEEERRSIARELHDELGQSITAVKSIALSIAASSEGRDAAVVESARLIATTAGGMYDAVHEMIPRLRPFSLDSFGLADALADLVGQHLRSHPQAAIRLQVAAGLPELEDDISTCVYRVVQESLVNALRHASPRHIEVSVAVEAGQLVAQVRDDGSGLALEGDSAGRYGVRGMRERAAALGGTFDLQALEQGTRALLRLPLEHR
jgi:two-component system sensor histidine kinase UhpB